MINITIHSTPAAYFHGLSYSVVNQYWHEYREWVDPFGDEILFSIHMTAQGIQEHLHALPPNHTTAYWQHMSPEDRGMAELQAGALQEQLNQLLNLIHYRLGELLAQEYPEGSDTPIITAKMQEYLNHRTPKARQRSREDLLSIEREVTFNPGTSYQLEEELRINRFFETASIHYLIPPTSRAAANWRLNILNNRDMPRRLIATSAFATESLRSWRQAGILFQRALDSSLDHLMNELILANNDHNILTGAAGKQRVALVDYGIPVPTVNTILAWNYICGQGCYRLAEPQRNISHVFFFQTPTLPVTNQHKTTTGKQSGAMGGDINESHSDHSLPVNSSAHIRTANGWLIHPRHDLCSVLVPQGMNAQHFQMMKEDNQDSMLIDAGRLMRGHLGLHRKTNWIGSAEYPGIFRLEFLGGFLPNPWSNDSTPMPINWYHELPLTSALRALAKQRIHMFFSDESEGESAARAWCDMYAMAMIEWLGIVNSPGHMPKIFKIINETERFIFKTHDGRKKAKGSQFSFDMNALNI